MQRQAKYTVLIVDDSASARQTLSDIIGSDPELIVMGAARDPYQAAEMIRRQVPDVIFLDIELPRMDGLTFLRKLMTQRPIPVVICSSLTEDGSAKMMEALEAGAVDVVSKPRVDTVHFLHESRVRICDAAKAAAQARLRPRAKPMVVEAKLSVDVILPKAKGHAKPIPRGTQDVVCIGASTGGTEALRVVLSALPADAPGIVVVQHMPAKFTTAFASRLDTLCEVEVREAQDGDPVLPGCVLIAPGDHHMMLQRVGTRYRVSIADGPPVSRHRPSVDVLFRSATLCAGPNAAGFLLTGMGDDGAQGLMEMRQAGAFTVAQDEESCVVFGMPNEAIKRGAACKVLPLDRIARAIMDHHRMQAAESARI